MRPIPEKVLHCHNRFGNVRGMNLTQYVLDQGGTAKLGCPVIASLAVTADCSASTLYMIAMGHKQSGPKLARRIERATGWAVSVHSLRPDVFGPTPADQAQAA
jgi:hypothetical protein